MSFELDYARLIQKYLSDTQDINLTICEIMQRPRWRRVWFLWKANEYYEGKPMPRTDLDECKNFYGD